MPYYRPPKQPKPITIDKWFGVNESTGQTEINQGEAIYMRNFRITENNKLSKRTGYKTLVNFGVDKPIRDMWHGVIGGVKQMIAVVDGKLYRVNYTLDIPTYTLIGSFSGDFETSHVYFNGKLWFFNGNDFKVFNGTALADVVPYVPTVSVGVAPNGSGGTAFEKINLLTGKKKTQFVGSGTDKDYILPEQSIDSTLLVVTVDGVPKVEITDFTVNRTIGKVTFTTAPIAASKVIIEWEKASTANPILVKGNRFASVYGVSNDTTIFAWGNTGAKNRRSFSGITSAGTDPTYWPSTNFTLTGADDYAITDIVTVYDRQIIFKEDQTFYSTPEFVQSAGKYDYPVYPLNYAVGNQVFNGVQVLDNNPVSFYSQSAYIWSNTYVKDERNADTISDNVVISFSSLDFSKAVTFDNQDDSEMWINIDNVVYIYNYAVKAWYMHDNIEANSFLKAERKLYFGTKHGKIMVFQSEYNDDGIAINAVLKSGFIDFGVPNLNKNTRDVWVVVSPASRTSADIKFATDRDMESDISDFVTVEYALFDWNYINFNDFTFLTNRNPQSVILKPRVKKYAYIQYIIQNNKLDQPLDFMSMDLRCETSGIHK